MHGLFGNCSNTAGKHSPEKWGPHPPLQVGYGRAGAILTDGRRELHCNVKERTVSVAWLQTLHATNVSPKRSQGNSTRGERVKTKMAGNLAENLTSSHQNKLLRTHPN